MWLQCVITRVQLISRIIALYFQMLSFDWSFWVRHLSTFASLEARITWMNYLLNTHSLSLTGSNRPAFQLCYFPTKSAPHITIRTFSDYPEFKTPFTSFFCHRRVLDRLRRKRKMSFKNKLRSAQRRLVAATRYCIRGRQNPTVVHSS